MSATPGKPRKPPAARAARATRPPSAEERSDILDALTTHLAVLDRVGKVLTTNAAWNHFAAENGGTGFSHTGVGTNYLTTCRKTGGQWAQAALAGLQSVLQQKRPAFNLEFPCDSPRAPRWFRMTVTPLAGESGGAVISQEAITPRLPPGLTLEGGTESQPLIFHSDADSIWLVSVEDGQGYRFESVNDTFLHFTGLTREQILHRRIEEWFPPGSLALALAKYGEVVATGRTLHYEETAELPAGRRVGQISVAPILNAAGHCTMLLATAHDITERRQAEEALRESEMALLEAQRVARIGSWAWNAVTDTIIWSEELFQIYGLDAGTAPPKYQEHLKLYTPESALRLNAAVAKTSQSGDAYELDLERRLAGGRRRWVAARGEAIRDAEGKIVGLRGTAQDITQRKMAEEALRESELRQRLALEGADLGLWDWDVPTGNFTVNERWCAILGYRREEIAPRIESWCDRIHPDDLPVSISAWAEHRDARTPAYEAEYRLRHKNGGWVWVLDKGRVVERAADGQPLRVCGTHLDITQRKEAETAQRQSEERFRQVTDTIDQVFWMTSVDKRRMLYISPGYERIWGRTCQSLYDAPLTWLDSVHPADLQSLIDAATTQQATGAYDVDYRILRPDGSERWIHDRAFPIRNTAGQVERIAGVAEDITRRKQAEEALRESRAILARAQELAHAGSYQVHLPTGDSSGWSPEIFHILGLDPANRELTTAQYFEQCVHPEDRLRVADSLGRALRTGQRYEADYRIVQPGGELRHVRTVAEPVPGSGSPPQKYIGFLQDVTEQRRLEAELLEISDHEQERIGQDLHDDLCQQLVGLEFRLQALQGELPEPSEARTELTRIGGLLRLATRYARTMAGVLSPVPPDPHGLMDALQSLATHAALLFRIECEYHCETPVLVADHTVAAHLYRIAQEAISNAFKHGRATRVLISLVGRVGEGHLTVEDNGSGCPLPIPPGKGMGTRIMQYRAGLSGATLHLEPADRGGLIVRCRFPILTP